MVCLPIYEKLSSADSAVWIARAPLTFCCPASLGFVIQHGGLSKQRTSLEEKISDQHSGTSHLDCISLAGILVLQMVQTPCLYHTPQQTSRCCIPGIGCCPNIAPAGCCIPIIGCCIPIMGCCMPIIGCCMPIIGCCIPIIGCCIVMPGICCICIPGMDCIPGMPGIPGFATTPPAGGTPPGAPAPAAGAPAA